ncbi:leucine-rich repeat protein kinase family protein [Actinidia rufa]|uniref:Leucine-rich repeat protein kinase family protein n=1 Tax=Actinidia rufa TaxID=165716 RepID=A0A7J0FV11_9ERIC|nr:leucine-rich repeat protein kinase family protein [Actinidia rufa]
MVYICPKRYPSGTARKLYARSTEPFKVLKRIGPDAFVIDLPPDSGISSTFNIEDLVAFKSNFAIPNDPFFEPIHEPTIDPPTTSTITITPLPIFPAPKEHIDAILDEQIISTRDGGVQRILVCWSGRPASDDTWITSDDLQQIDRDLFEYYQSSSFTFDGVEFSSPWESKCKEPLSFAMRLRFALGSAKGILYLHTEADPPIFHRDIKASNILMDPRFNAKVADFGLSRLAPVPDIEGDTPAHVSTVVKGTPGYLDPEYFLTRMLTDKSDVYSLGVVISRALDRNAPNLTRQKHCSRGKRRISIWDDLLGHRRANGILPFGMRGEVCKLGPQVLPREDRSPAFNGRGGSRARNHMVYDAGVRHQNDRILDH